MFMALLLALLTVVIFGGTLHLFFPKIFYDHPRWFTGAAAVSWVTMTICYYINVPFLNLNFWAWLWFWLFCFVTICWCARIIYLDDVRYRDGWEWFRFWGKFVLKGFLALAIASLPHALSSEAFQARAYANLAGPMEARVWHDDTQPANAAHVRLVSSKMAHWVAQQQLGAAPGAIGSQFQINEGDIHLQTIRGKLWWIAPLDFSGFLTWWSARVSPGYVMVDAENPTAQPILRLNHQLRYTVDAGWQYNLERYLWSHGYVARGITNSALEIDENERPWWVVSVYRLAIGAYGRQPTGVVIVNPENGNQRFYGMNEIPRWVDLAVPGELVEENLNYHGSLQRGWMNSWYQKVGLTEVGDPRFTFGTDGEPYWVSEITSTNGNDQSMLGLTYTHARTGVSHTYRTNGGGTEAAILAAVNNAVSYRRLHGEDPTFYHVHGTMAAITPLLGENHTFQGVAIANVSNLQQQVAIGGTAVAALREYESILATAVSGRMNGIEAAAQTSTLTGRVRRVAAEHQSTGPVYYLLLEGSDILFRGASELSTELVMTRDGDEVEIRFIPSEHGITALSSFDNRTITVRP